MSRPSLRLRWRFQGRAVVLLAAVWVLLWGEPSLLNILYGLVLGWLVTVVFWLPPIRYYGEIRLGGVLLLVLTQLRDLAVASFQLAATAFRPRITLRSGIVKVRLHTNSDLFQVAVAVLISIVPGTLVVDSVRRPRLLYLHVFDLPDAGAVKRQRAHALAIEARLIRAFGSADDRRALAQRTGQEAGRP
ncbi:MAG: Na+/H+ antiporter subunit E [Propionicimonas sp.]|uniref:Na+/H+ antiporter subunit E n=1 Tax=Propionicimonas sp. TaxID=1955623 RepID=UPI002B1F7D12|nr:Na+/H+ antiporter subunit E [Propionicimonas sp.]MEA4943023.1 Na+/H+ antiporter subunit E [Propionicimonas sp.]MEA5055150.1 Na+/H+ antiporter subunit E [Propionicimonas sp.]